MAHKEHPSRLFVSASFSFVRHLLNPSSDCAGKFLALKIEEVH
jgi:hypothetical protein